MALALSFRYSSTASACSAGTRSNPAEPLHQVKLLAALRRGDPALTHPFLIETGRMYMHAHRLLEPERRDRRKPRLDIDVSRRARGRIRRQHRHPPPPSPSHYGAPSADTQQR
ncbi:hypothetical protein PLICRDRAFT_266953 [Plicaturopsis crispa FD-325 SS-3]|nr:hypothetical protein PLICRDRAFT_266953 [Plicaturopsis crispa FD-325 SS-3]